MAPRVELLWWDGCPSTPKALELVQEALTAEGLDPAAVEMREVSTSEDAEHEEFVGSPTIRIDGADVSPPEGEPMGLSCRVYRLRDGRVSPTPDAEDIRDAIRRTSQ